MSIEETKKLRQETHMKRPDEKATLVPTYNYDQARQKAVSWLGDRYLLAEPARKRDDGSKGFLKAPSDWYVISGTAARTGY
jgi:hypothetical protein